MSKVSDLPDPEQTFESKAVAKCIYFSDATIVAKVNDMLMKYPRASLSNVVSQLITGFATALEATPEGERCIKIETKVWL